MKISNLFLASMLVSGLAAGCGKKGADAGGGDKPKVDVSPEMTTFLAGFKGKSSDVKAALKASGVDGLDGKDMDMYDMASPTVTATEKKGDKTCYTFDAKAGMTTRTYETCWAGGKITEVADKGMH